MSTEVRTLDGRVLIVHDTGVVGRDDDPVLLWHHGSPATGALLPPVVAAARVWGARVISYARPGYGGSTSSPGRDVASAATDVVQILDALGVDRAFALGYSGGGPHALACAALLAHRVPAVAVLAGVAPFTDDAPWWEGMAAPGGLRAATHGREARAVYALSETFDTSVFVDDDWAALEGPWAVLGGDAAQAESAGPDGLVDDDVAYVSPWGADLGAVAQPALVVQGGRDRVVPPTHGTALIQHLARGELWHRPRDGHVSVLAAVPLAIDWLLQQR
ncbi:alpha/beta hydrolase [Luteimicrobium xylanilyticum]|uniref:3-oxoadipate enol-lactonase n=1 Tax=Luteimicrobium xylanilyticum TaxID=1133546 RepID=A0A5P9Q6K3_9MICO|nr:alpha/beta fold hydrolase [Luteimicrobium xylanilyticum]QFU96906.1 3-oxoadipate enol-lactonase [Luteimicrobium xylanilyticum]